MPTPATGQTSPVTGRTGPAVVGASLLSHFKRRHALQRVYRAVRSPTIVGHLDPVGPLSACPGPRPVLGPGHAGNVASVEELESCCGSKCSETLPVIGARRLDGRERDLWDKEPEW